MADATRFRKRNAQGLTDGGAYASRKAYAVAPAANVGNKAGIPVTRGAIKYGRASRQISKETDSEPLDPAFTAL
eukprot:CAMPEP_0175168990 /NCGR_PEP_ID=MMETSP0087-20121206/29294_1 /TAXON_ID=136419 /ORGANISM="Unknown Unknown, Strain D1" /LENGTH=73 /DNA_ID=CAMNT_0016459231 /DNA_START=11 /DNA_END=229 /DNA_ORIENTATION=-